jgi:hypothetical protein
MTNVIVVSGLGAIFLVVFFALVRFIMAKREQR